MVKSKTKKNFNHKIKDNKYTREYYLGRAIQGHWVPRDKLKYMRLKHKPTQKKLSEAIQKSGKGGRIRVIYKNKQPIYQTLKKPYKRKL